MKRILSFLPLLPCLLLFCTQALAATTANAAKADPLPVAVSILPQKYFLERLGGDRLKVLVMVEPGASPHTYEPKPRQMAELARAKAYFAIGVTFEDAWLPRFAAANPEMRVVHTDLGIEKLPMAEHRHHDEDAGHGHEAEAEEHEPGGHADHDHGTLDPHIWLDPALAAVQSTRITDALTEIDPANAETYRANQQKFLLELVDLDKNIRAVLDAIPAGQRKFLVFHPSWGYFAKTYDLEQIPMEAEGKEPSLKDMERLIRRAKSENIRVVFVQPQFSDKSAQTLAQEINATVVKLDPLAENWADNLLRAAQSFKEALQ